MKGHSWCGVQMSLELDAKLSIGDEPVFGFLDNT